MSMRDLLVQGNDGEKVTIRSKHIFVPVQFWLPEEAVENMAIADIRDVEGNKILRFYTMPSQGDYIDWMGHRWVVERLQHAPQKKGSTARDVMPNVFTEYLGPLETE
jgi:hypothetical protein